jgi:hypothetical protein
LRQNSAVDWAAAFDANDGYERCRGWNAKRLASLQRVEQAVTDDKSALEERDGSA